MAVGGTGAGGTTTGGPTGGGGTDEGGTGAPGNGRGRGVPPVVAQAATETAITTGRRALTPRNAKYCKRRNPFSYLVFAPPILDTSAGVRHHVSGYGAGAPSQRIVRASQSRSLAKGDYALVPGEGGGDRGS